MVAGPALQWAALRALHEGAAASLDLLAQASGRSPAAMHKRAASEGWRDAEAAKQLSGQEKRLKALLDQQIGKAEAAGVDETGSASADKARMDADAGVQAALKAEGLA